MWLAHKTQRTHRNLAIITNLLECGGNDGSEHANSNVQVPALICISDGTANKDRMGWNRIAPAW